MLRAYYIGDSDNWEYKDLREVTQVVQEGTMISLEDNTDYLLDIVDSDTCSYQLPSGLFECWMRLTIASGATFSITFVPATGQTIKYIGDPPVFSSGETWELSIKDHVIASAKVG